MRIIAGHLKGRRLLRPAYEVTRPTQNRVREAALSILTSRVSWQDQWVLDAFAGSGSLGIEALSRGAKGCVFFESHGQVAFVLKQNIHTLGLENQSKIFVKDLFKGSFKDPPLFDVVFLDPPYHKGLILKSLNFLHENKWLKDKAWIYIEVAKDDEDLTLPEFFNMDVTRFYGSIKIIMVQYIQSP